MSKCNWTEDDSGTWYTECGEAFVLTTCDDPSKHGMKWCCYCGKELVSVAYKVTLPEPVPEPVKEVVKICFEDQAAVEALFQNDKRISKLEDQVSALRKAVNRLEGRK